MGKSYVDMGGYRTFYITQKADAYDLLGFAKPNVIIEVSLSRDSTYSYNVVLGGTATDRSGDVVVANTVIKFVY